MNVIFKNVIDILEKNITGNSNYSFDEIDYIKVWYNEHALGSLNVLINHLKEESVRCKKMEWKTFIIQNNYLFLFIKKFVLSL